MPRGSRSQIGVPSLRAQFMIREIDAAHVVDVPARELCRAAGMDLALLDDPVALIPLRQISEVYDHAARLAGDDALGLHVGERAGPRIVDVIDYALMSRPTLAKAFEELRPLVVGLYSEAELDLATREGMGVFTYRMDPHEADRERHRCEALLVSVTKLAQHAIGRDDPPLSVAFQHKRPADVSEHARIFRAPVKFGWPTNELTFSARWLTAPLTTADANLSAVLDRHLQDLLARLPKGASFAHEARRRLAAAYRSGPVQLSSLAKSLGLSERTLQRRLQEEGTSLHELTEGVRHELSLVLLRNKGLTLVDIAARLGYASQAAFSRAFRRWRGVSPAVHRRQEKS